MVRFNLKYFIKINVSGFLSLEEIWGKNDQLIIQHIEVKINNMDDKNFHNIKLLLR